jgi:hypothetical protein
VLSLVMARATKRLLFSTCQGWLLMQKVMSYRHQTGQVSQIQSIQVNKAAKGWMETTWGQQANVVEQGQLHDCLWHLYTNARRADLRHAFSMANIHQS